MDKRSNAGIVAVIVAALVGMNYLPRATQENTAAPTQQTDTLAERGSPSEAGVFGPCKSIIRLLSPYYGSENAVPYPTSCHPPVKAPAISRHSPRKAPPVSPANLDLIVAILPNPLHTNLPLVFDRAVEAIQQAAQDEGYSYDASWFPWSDEKREYATLQDDTVYRDRRHQLEHQPGIIVFRRTTGVEPEESTRAITAQAGQSKQAPSPGEEKASQRMYEKGLVVFVVGEQPTHGIDGSQFEATIEWLSSLGAPLGKPFRIVGPTFSGSLPSLAGELKSIIEVGRQQAQPKWPYGFELKVSSGSVSQASNVWDFCTKLRGPLRAPINVGKKEDLCRVAGVIQVEFRSYNQSTELNTERFCRYLQSEGYALNRLAIVSEDQTDFGIMGRFAGCVSQDNEGQAKTGTQAGPVYLKYPRDIAALRGAYERQSSFTEKKQGSPGAPSTALQGKFVEPTGTQLDSPRNYAGQLDLLAQESLLRAMVEQLKMNSAQFVLVSSTNSLDQIFLSEFLSRAYPQGRIVLTGSDLLFLRGGQGMSSRGIMTLSTYPLLPGSQRWSPTLRVPHNGSYRVFGQDTMEGLYLATRASLADDAEPKSPIPIYDFLPPRWAPVDPNAQWSEDDLRPATWLTVIGHGRFWPLAALNNRNSEFEPQSASLLKPAFTDGKPDKIYEVPSDDRTQGAHLLFPIEMYALLLLCVAMAAWHLFCCWRGSIAGQFETLTYFAPQPRREYSQLLFLGSLIVGWVAAIFGVLSGLTYNSVLPRYLFWVLCGATTWVFVCALLSIAVNQSLPRIHCYPKQHASNLEQQSYWKKFGSQVRKRRRAILVSAGWLAFGILSYATLLHFSLISRLTPANRLPAFWRAVNLFSFVSPLLPQMLLLFGLRGWFWCNLHGLTLLSGDRPLLPKEKQLPLTSDEMRLDAHGRPLMRIFGREAAQRPIEAECTPLGRDWQIMFLKVLVPLAVVFRLSLHDWYIASLGEEPFGIIVFWWLVLVSALLLADTIQLLRTWQSLRGLLVLLDRIRLRRTLAAMRGIAWGSVWKMGGGVLEERYRVISRQFECLGNLGNLLRKEAQMPSVDNSVLQALASVNKCAAAFLEFARWHVDRIERQKKNGRVRRPTPGRPDILARPEPEIRVSVAVAGSAGSVLKVAEPSAAAAEISNRPEFGVTESERSQWRENDIGPVARFQEAVAHTAGVVMSEIVLPAWKSESHSLLVDKARLEGKESATTDVHRPFAPSVEVSDLVRAAEEFVAIPYLGVIQNTIGRIRLMAFGMLSLFLGMTLAVASYPFGPQQVLGRILVVLFLGCGLSVAVVYGGMFRDATLSYVTDTNPGQLGWQFWLKLATFGIGPLAALLAALFPALTDVLVSFIQPGAQALK